MKTLYAMLALALTPALWGGPMGHLGSNELALAQSFATTNMAAFKSIIDGTNVAFFGFHSTNEIAKATNAGPLMIYIIPLDRLRDYHPGDDTRALLEPSSRVIFPLLVGTNVRSSISFRVNTTANSVSGVKFGQRRLIRELMQTYRSILPSDLLPGSTPFIVEIPLFDIWLVGYVDPQDKVVLLATIDLPIQPMTLNRGQRVSEEALFRLAVMARQYNGLPN